MPDFLHSAIVSLSAAGAAWAGRVLDALPLTVVFVLIVWGVVRLGRRSLTPSARCWVWWLACVKVASCLLCVPLIPLALLPEGQSAAPFARRVGLGQRFGADVPAPAAGDTAPVRAAVNAPTSPRLSVVGGVFALWVAGIAIGLGQTGAQALVLWRVRRRSRELSNTDTAVLLRRLSAQLGLSAPPGLAASDEITTPLVCGGFRSTVLLPTATLHLPPPEIEMILAHELAHVRRGDLWLGLVPWIAGLVTFWMPLLSLPLVRSWEAEREAACDRLAVQVSGAAPTTYSRLLLKIVGQDARSRRGFLGAVGATLAFHTLHGRLEALKSPVPAPRRLGSLTLLAVLPLGLLLVLRPVAVRGRDTLTPLSPAVPYPTTSSDVDDVPIWNIRIGGDMQKRYLLSGAGVSSDLSRADAPQGGYALLVVLPGGTGGDDFNWFVRRIAKRALGGRYVVAHLVAPRWDARQFNEVVWPTRLNPWPGMRFSTEEFIADAIRDVSARLPVNPRRVHVLGWASGGPGATAALLSPDVPLSGGFIAMSVFDVGLEMPPATRDRPMFVLHPEDAAIVPLRDAEAAVRRFRDDGRAVELLGYKGGYGWHGDVYRQIRRGIAFLER